MTGHRRSGVVILDPTSPMPGRRAGRKLAQRPATLRGAVVGLVANGLGVGEQLLDAVFEELRRDEDLAGRVRILRWGLAAPSDGPDWERITSEATVAITGFGG